MQNLLEKVVGSKETPFPSKKKLLQQIISSLKSNEQKVGVLKSVVEYLLNQHSDFPHKVEMTCEALGSLTTVGADYADVELMLEALRETEELEVIVTWIKHIARGHTDKTTANSLKAIWVRKVSKDETLWNTHYLKELITYKEKQIKQQVSQQNQTSVQAPPPLPPLLKNFNNDCFAYRISVVFEFLTMNQSFQAHGVDLREVFIAWLLLLRLTNPDVTSFAENLIIHIIDLCEKSNNHYLPCFKAIFRVLRFQYSSEETLQPPYGAYEFFQRIRISALETCSNPHLYDTKWDKNDWSRVFKNLIRVGLSENVGIVFLSLCKNFAASKYFEILIKVQEDNMPMIISALKLSEWQDASLSILKFLLKDGPINSTLMKRVIDKLFKTLQELEFTAQLGFSEELAIVVYQLSLKYANTPVGQEFETRIKELYTTANLHQALEKAKAQKQGFQNWSDPNSAALQEQLPFRGINNIGNTCYMNSFVQALFMTKEFRYRILCLSLSELGQTKNDMDQLQESKADPHYLASRKKLVAMFQLQKVFALLMTAQRPAINPQFFKASLPDFFKNSFAQQDSSEFGKVYLDEIEKSIKDTNEKNLISELFTGELTSAIVCKDCENRSEKHENFLDLGAHFDEKDKTKHYPLREMLLKNFEDERFENDNSFFCEKCGKKSSLAIKETRATRFPPVLMITLHRFYFDVSTLKRLKLTNFVDIPNELTLDLPVGKDGLPEEFKYNLFAAVVHRGSTLDFGHYYCIAKDDYSKNEWALFDDSTVKVLSQDIDVFEYVKKHNEDAPYILFYHQAGKYGENKAKESFKLSSALSRIVEQDNMQHLKEIENSTKAFTSLASLNLTELGGMMQSSVYKKDNNDDDSNNPENGFNSMNNRFIF